MTQPYNTINEVLRLADQDHQDDLAGHLDHDHVIATVDLAIEALMGCEAVVDSLEQTTRDLQGQHINDTAEIAILQHQAEVLKENHADHIDEILAALKVPDDERWLYRNRKALVQVTRGLAQASKAKPAGEWVTPKQDDPLVIKRKAKKSKGRV